MSTRPEDVQATFAATLVDEWARRGVRHAVVSPGSRSTPLALALAEHPDLTVHVHHDERGAGFMALGIGLASGVAAVALTTSGTAAVELHPAVVEADLARVPLLVCTADRPPELQDVGAPQAIDQVHLYGRAVRWFHAPGVADDAARDRWRPLAARALAATAGAARGPVHLNLAFREPLLGRADALPPPGPVDTAIDAGPGPAAPREGDLERAVGAVLARLSGRRGVVIAGPGSGPGAAVDALASALGWPVLAAPQAQVWGVPGATVPAADALLRVAAVAEELRPEAVLRLGMPLASRVVGEWVAASGAFEVVASGPGRWTDPHGTADVVVPLEPGALLGVWAPHLSGLAVVDDGAWLRGWVQAGAAAATAIAGELASAGDPTEPGIARAVVAASPEGTALVVSSSMPIRDVEWYAEARPGLHVHANRGANGIDGVVATGIGIALATRRPTTVLIGDVAFLHDITSLAGAAARGVDLTVVVVDNDGGGIFSFLPQATAVPEPRFEALFGTPHGLDVVALAAALGAEARSVTDQLGAALVDAREAGGVHVLVVRTHRSENVQLHRRLEEAVARALGHGTHRSAT